MNRSEHIAEAERLLQLAKDTPSIPDANHCSRRAAVHVELAKVIDTVVVRRFESENVLEEGAPDGYRWASYGEIIDALSRDGKTIDEAMTRQDVDHLSNAGIQIIVKVTE